MVRIVTCEKEQMRGWRGKKRGAFRFDCAAPTNGLQSARFLEHQTEGEEGVLRGEEEEDEVVAVYSSGSS